MNVPKDKRNRYPDDDGRVIAPMNVEGMPWHTKADAPASTLSGWMLDKRQTRYAMLGALKASMLVAGVFSLAMILFVLFALNVWLK